MDKLPTNQRMFHGGMRAAALADQLAARFHERHYRTSISTGQGTALVQIGSQHGTPVTVHIADTAGGVMVTMSRDRDWADRLGDAGQMIERASNGSWLSVAAMLPEVMGELTKENLSPAIWDAINDMCALTRALSGEEKGPVNPVVCQYCQTSNPPGSSNCAGCGAALPVNLPRLCPKCGRSHLSDALFCQACGTRLVNG